MGEISIWRQLCYPVYTQMSVVCGAQASKSSHYSPCVGAQLPGACFSLLCSALLRSALLCSTLSTALLTVGSALQSGILDYNLHCSVLLLSQLKTCSSFLKLHFF